MEIENSKKLIFESWIFWKGFKGAMNFRIIRKCVEFEKNSRKKLSISIFWIFKKILEKNSTSLKCLSFVDKQFIVMNLHNNSSIKNLENDL